MPDLIGIHNPKEFWVDISSLLSDFIVWHRGYRAAGGDDRPLDVDALSEFNRSVKSVAYENFED